MAGRGVLLPLVIFLTFLLGIPLLVAGIWLATQEHVDCFNFLEWPIIVIGGLLIIASIFGILGYMKRSSPLVLLYFGLTFLLLLLLITFTVFAFAVTIPGGGHELSFASYHEYYLDDYSDWLRGKMSNPGRWSHIRACLHEGEVCSTLKADYPSLQSFNQAKLGSIQSGCCKPPSSCNFTFVTPIHWVGATTSYNDPDCAVWSNDQYKLCFDCSSCKAGVAQTIRKNWLKVAKVSIIVLVLLAIVLLLAFVLFQRARKQGAFDGRRRSALA